MNTLETLSKTFWKRTKKLADGCIVWTGTKQVSGYGELRLCGKKCGAHVVAYLLAHGEGSIREGNCVLHDCPTGDNKACVNHEHLWQGTHEQNAKDRYKKNRTAQGVKSGSFNKPNSYPSGSNHWTHRHPEWLAKGSKHGTATHPEISKQRRSATVKERKLIVRRANV